MLALRIQNVVEWSLILVLLAGIRWFRVPRTARWSNIAVGLGLLACVALVASQTELHRHHILLAALSIGVLFGVAASIAVSMLGIPSLIALQNGAGGFAAAVVSFVELARVQAPVDPLVRISAVAALAVGTVTFSGSLLACGRLSGLLRSAPRRWRGHNVILGAVVLLALVGAVESAFLVQTAHAAAWGALLAVAGLLLGVLAPIRVGGADMPVLISTLNAMSGLAAAFAGVVLHSGLLIACGAAVASSGLVLTGAMCRAMNRRLAAVFTGSCVSTIPDVEKQAPAHPLALRAQDASTLHADCVLPEAVKKLRQARRIIIVPGYGMALAKAQGSVAELSEHLQRGGAEVSFAVHPVAGRMPGHMYVLLAEVGVDYARMLDLDPINERFKEADVALVVGACDVVNPAASDTKGTPLSGMPILLAHQAKTVIVCNLDAKPGYSGVDNPLYAMERTMMLLGDANATVEKLLKHFRREEHR